jgi:hypothetical protein
MHPSTDAADSPKSGHSRTAAAIVLVAVTVVIACVTIWNLRQDALKRATLEANSLGILLAEQNARLMQATELVLQNIQELVTTAGRIFGADGNKKNSLASSGSTSRGAPGGRDLVNRR